MTTRIGLLLFPRLTQLDLTGPYEVFARLPEAQVLLVGSGEARSDTGLRLQPDVGHADAPQLDVICVPGGPGVNDAMEDEALLRFLRAQAERAAWVTSVCTGALVLGAAGLLRGLPRDHALAQPGSVDAVRCHAGARARGDRPQPRDGRRRHRRDRFRAASGCRAARREGGPGDPAPDGVRPGAAVPGRFAPQRRPHASRIRLRGASRAERRTPPHRRTSRRQACSRLTIPAPTANRRRRPGGRGAPHARARWAGESSRCSEAGTT